MYVKILNRLRWSVNHALYSGECVKQALSCLALGSVNWCLLFKGQLVHFYFYSMLTWQFNSFSSRNMSIRIQKETCPRISTALGFVIVTRNNLNS